MLMDLLIQAGSRRKIGHLMKWGVLYASVITLALILVDSRYYCKLVIAPLNIILYNVFTSHGANLYGVEPASFYLVNSILNFNLAVLFALVALPLCSLVSRLTRLTSVCVGVRCCLAGERLQIAVGMQPFCNPVH